MSDKTPPIRSIEDIHGCYRTGTVRGVGNWSETHVHASSSGGGGYLHNGSGHVSAPTVSVSSTTTEVLRFFIECGEDDEEEMTIKGGGFAVRDGQRVSVIRVSSQPNWGYNVAFYNHNTGNLFAPESRLAWPLDGKPTRKAILGGMFLGLFGGMLLGPLWFIGLIVGIGWTWHNYRQKMARYRTLIAAVRAKVDELVQETKAEHARTRKPVAIEAA